MTTTDSCLETITPRLQFDVLDQTGKKDFEGESPVVGPLDWNMAKGISLYLGRHTTDKIQSNNLIFKNKVVSRQHAEVWTGDQNKASKAKQRLPPIMGTEYLFMDHRSLSKIWDLLLVLF